ncbi:hypothetical protein ANN_12036 [Periplaneta americana]|uniref:DUF1279 domain-containing protein n=2 Tax=Periplaneta americana TaxID=6978 RepID=A0ABQ8T902_PERAM|nr:hypothetical protein ANN_12036 [Periplaneta americana]
MDVSCQSQELHLSSVKQYSAIQPLPLPDNIEEINAAEMAVFSPQRERDISGPVILSKTPGNFLYGCARDYNQQSYPLDLHVASYDCRGTVSLSSVMQTMVPEPFSKEGRATYLNMPGGQWGQGHKYISRDMHNTHYQALKSAGGDNPGTLDRTRLSAKSFCIGNCLQMGANKWPLQNMSCLRTRPVLTHINFPYSTNTDNSNLSRTDKLKRAVKEYGATVIVFHIGISLISLGGFYLAVTSGVDLSGIVSNIGGGEVAAEASNFVVAYALHKMLAPVRIGITLAAVPVIVRYLRKIGFLKAPKPPA